MLRGADATFSARLIWRAHALGNLARSAELLGQGARLDRDAPKQVGFYALEQGLR